LTAGRQTDEEALGSLRNQEAGKLENKCSGVLLLGVAIILIYGVEVWEKCWRDQHALLHFAAPPNMRSCCFECSLSCGDSLMLRWTGFSDVLLGKALKAGIKVSNCI
jgi:hypothetical protein